MLFSSPLHHTAYPCKLGKLKGFGFNKKLVEFQDSGTKEESQCGSTDARPRWGTLKLAVPTCRAGMGPFELSSEILQKLTLPSSSLEKFP